MVRLFFLCMKWYSVVCTMRYTLDSVHCTSNSSYMFVSVCVYLNFMCGKHVSNKAYKIYVIYTLNQYCTCSCKIAIHFIHKHTHFACTSNPHHKITKFFWRLYIVFAVKYDYIFLAEMPRNEDEWIIEWGDAIVLGKKKWMIGYKYRVFTQLIKWSYIIWFTLFKRGCFHTNTHKKIWFARTRVQKRLYAMK